MLKKLGSPSSPFFQHKVEEKPAWPLVLRNSTHIKIYSSQIKRLKLGGRVLLHISYNHCLKASVYCWLKTRLHFSMKLLIQESMLSIIVKIYHRLAFMYVHSMCGLACTIEISGPFYRKQFHEKSKVWSKNVAL